MAYLISRKLKINSETDPRTLSIIVSGDKIPPLYTGEINFADSILSDVANTTLATGETLDSEIKGNSVINALPASGSSINCNAIVTLKRRASSSAENKTVIIKIDFNTKIQSEYPSNFSVALIIYASAHGITTTDYFIKTAAIFYKEDQ